MTSLTASVDAQRYTSLYERKRTAARKHLLNKQQFQYMTPGYRGGYPWGLQFRSLNDARHEHRGDYEQHDAAVSAETDAWIREKPYHVTGCEDPAVQADPVYQKVHSIVRSVVVDRDRSNIPAQWRDDKELEGRINHAFIGMHAQMFTRQMGGLDYSWFEEASPADILRVFSKPVQGYTGRELDERAARRAKHRAVTMRA